MRLLVWMQFKLGGHNLHKLITNFPYLGSHLSLRADSDAEIQHHLQSVGLDLGRLRKRVFDDQDICIDTKILVYKTEIPLTVLYGLETWTMYRCHLKILERHSQQCLKGSYASL